MMQSGYLIEKRRGRGGLFGSLSALLAMFVSACVSAPPQQSRGPTGLPPPPAVQYSRSQPLFGWDAKQLTARFGEPRLDIRDKTVRKLQFITTSKCVLDAYLYAVSRGREPTVSHIDTRLADGRDVTPAACGIQ